jgi:hypothetical protein
MTVSFSNNLLQQCIISIGGGHSGVPVTHRRLKQLFYWKGMKSAVHNFLQTCQICLQAKPHRVCYPRKLQPLPIPNEAWEIISMDFVERLPRSGNANYILVMADKFTRYGHFIPLSHPYTSNSVAALFMSSVQITWFACVHNI